MATDRWELYKPRSTGKVLARMAEPGEVVPGSGPFSWVTCEGGEVLISVGPLILRMDLEVFNRMYESAEEKP